MIQEILADYELWETLIRKTKRKLEDLYQKKLSITAVNDGLPRGTAVYTMEDYMAEKEELEEDLVELLHKRNQAYDEIMRLLVSLNDLRQREVLILRYIELKSWKRIQKEMRLSRSRCYDLHRDAIEILEKLFTEPG